MIDLSQSSAASPLIQTVPVDPGTSWKQDVAVVLDAPPDDDVFPEPDAQWPKDGVRTGICGTVTPRVITLPDGSYRMYYTQILPRPEFPVGANDYGNASTRILSATSTDGSIWMPESGVRLSSRNGGAGDFRVVCGDVVPCSGGDGQLRMYYECCTGSQEIPNAIRSAVSVDGLAWTMEPGVRFSGRAYSSPRIVFLEDGRCRLYLCERGIGIISGLSEDGGLTFHQDPGVRVRPGELSVAFAPEIIRIATGGYVMYYAGYKGADEACIFRAVSEDGLIWEKENVPTISPTPGTWDGAKCSEMCVYRLPLDNRALPRYRMVYEACDGTARDKRGVWRVGSATTKKQVADSAGRPTPFSIEN